MPYRIILCIIDGCEEPQNTRQLCRKHYNAAYHAKALMPESRREAIARFLSEAIASNTDDCIDWPFCMSGAGYGQTWLNGRGEGAHSYVCREAHGECPEDKHVAAHSCNRRSCVNPRHLRWATHAENHKDKLIHGTSVAGERNSRSKLTERAVRIIRAERGKTPQLQLAARFGVSQVKISQIQLGKAWRHVR